MPSNIPVAPKSQYEIERDERIKRNEGFMLSIGIDPHGGGYMKQNKKKAPPKPRLPRKKVPESECRRSPRLAGEPALVFSDAAVERDARESEAPPKMKKAPPKMKKAPPKKAPSEPVRVEFGRKIKDHNDPEKRKAQSLLNKLAKEAKLTADATIWGLGEDRDGPRMSRAVKLLKRVADPKDPMRYSDARLAMRSQKGRKKAGRKKAKKPTVAKHKKST